MDRPQPGTGGSDWHEDGHASARPSRRRSQRAMITAVSRRRPACRRCPTSRRRSRARRRIIQRLPPSKAFDAGQPVRSPHRPRSGPRGQPRSISELPTVRASSGGVRYVDVNWTTPLARLMAEDARGTRVSAHHRVIAVEVDEAVDRGRRGDGEPRHGFVSCCVLPSTSAPSVGVSQTDVVGLTNSTRRCSRSRSSCLVTA